MGGQEILAYECKLALRVAGRQYLTKVLFSTELPVGSVGVLGNKGFFDKFSVNFRYREKYFEVF